MPTIKLLPLVGDFAENKDMAREIRQIQIVPAFQAGEEVILDFEGVQSTTQSFIHALISELIRDYGADILDRLSFKNCNEVVQKIVTIVTDYMQESN